MSDETLYDVIIVGGSIAATAAGIYAARRQLKFKIIAKDLGGEVATSGEIGNWPGIIHTDGLTLAGDFRKHLESYKPSIEEGVAVSKITKQGDGNFCITTGPAGTNMASEKIPSNNTSTLKCDYLTRAVIVATGVHPRELNVPGEKEFRNKGVSYCTVCDGPLFGGQTVVTVGGGNSALESVLMLADIAEKVYVMNKNNAFKGEQILIDKVQSKKNIEIIYSAKTKSIQGEKVVTGLTYTDSQGVDHNISVQGIFIHIGMIPNSDIVSSDVAKNEFGEIKVNMAGETSVPGLYAAGDVTDVPHKQIVIAAGQGCSALLSAVQYLNRS